MSSLLDPGVLLGRILVILLAIPIHEWAHCWVASLLGDDTPGHEGRLTLNPLAHLDPLGTLMILVSGFGWGRAARVNPYRMRKVRNPRVGMALSALAGPVSNLIQAAILSIPLRFSGWVEFLPAGVASIVWDILLMAFAINIGLAMFNLLPIPPLDGSRILAGVASPRVAAFIESLEPIAVYVFLGVLFVLPRIGIDVVSWLVWPMVTVIEELMLGIDLPGGIDFQAMPTFFSFFLR